MPRGRGHKGALSLLLALACTPAVGSGDTRAQAAHDPRSPPVAAAAAPAEPGGPFEVQLDGQAPRAPRAALVSGEGHAERVGWSPDGERFVHCRALPGDCYACRIVGRNGGGETVESGPGCPDGIPRAELEARLAAESAGPGATRWRWGDEVVLVVETREAEQTNAGEPRPLLKVGAQRREGGTPAWALHVDPCQGCGLDQRCTGQAHLDALSLSPDGHVVVALVHERGNDGADTMRVERLSAERMAEAARIPASHAGP